MSKLILHLIDEQIADLKANIERHKTTGVYIENCQRWAIQLAAIEGLYDQIINHLVQRRR